MRLLVDTNVVLDFLLQRKGAEEARQVFLLAEKTEEIEFVSATAITDVFYLVNKALKEAEANSKRRKRTKRSISLLAQSYVESLMTFIQILPVEEADIKCALQLKWEDFEDAVQYSIALHHGLDGIITRNKSDYEVSKIPIFTPSEFLKRK